MENNPNAWGQPCRYTGKNLRTPHRESFPHPNSPGHVSCPQVFPRSLPMATSGPHGPPRGYPQRTPPLYYNDKGYEYQRHMAVVRSTRPGLGRGRQAHRTKSCAPLAHRRPGFSSAGPLRRARCTSPCRGKPRRGVRAEPPQGRPPRTVGRDCPRMWCNRPPVPGTCFEEPSTSGRSAVACAIGCATSTARTPPTASVTSAPGGRGGGCLGRGARHGDSRQRRLAVRRVWTRAGEGEEHLSRLWN